MPTDFFIKQGDKLPKIKATLRDSTGAAINLAGATVQFRMRAKGETGAAKFTSSATVTGASTGQVEYSWASSDTDAVGKFDAEWIVSFAGDLETVPNNGYITVQVVDNLTTP